MSLKSIQEEVRAIQKNLLEDWENRRKITNLKEKELIKKVKKTGGYYNWFGITHKTDWANDFKILKIPCPFCKGKKEVKIFCERNILNNFTEKRVCPVCNGEQAYFVYGIFEITRDDGFIC